MEGEYASTPNLEEEEEPEESEKNMKQERRNEDVPKKQSG